MIKIKCDMSDVRSASLNNKTSQHLVLASCPCRWTCGLDHVFAGAGCDWRGKGDNSRRADLALIDRASLLVGQASGAFNKTFPACCSWRVCGTRVHAKFTQRTAGREHLLFASYLHLYLIQSVTVTCITSHMLHVLHHTPQKRLRKLEGLRMEVDARRRRVHARYRRALERMTSGHAAALAHVRGYVSRCMPYVRGQYAPHCSAFTCFRDA